MLVWDSPPRLVVLHKSELGHIAHNYGVKLLGEGQKVSRPLVRAAKVIKGHVGDARRCCSHLESCTVQDSVFRIQGLRFGV